MELSFLTAITIGFIGSTHCVAMCGGIVGSLNSNILKQNKPSELLLIMHHSSYNVGRIISYMIAGFFAGLIGAQTGNLPLHFVLPVGSIIAASFMIVLGLYIGGWMNGLFWIEKAGGQLWKLIQPFGNRFLPAKSLGQVFGLGLVWGWLPCGLVYSVLVLALVSASPIKGALLMLGFGLGTFPMLFAMGKLSEYLLKITRIPLLRQAMGGIIILFGIYSGFLTFSNTGHEHHHSPQFRSFIFSR